MILCLGPLPSHSGGAFRFTACRIVRPRSSVNPCPVARISFRYPGFARPRGQLSLLPFTTDHESSRRISPFKKIRTRRTHASKGQRVIVTRRLSNKRFRGRGAPLAERFTGQLCTRPEKKNVRYFTAKFVISPGTAIIPEGANATRRCLRTCRPRQRGRMMHSSAHHAARRGRITQSTELRGCCAERFTRVSWALPRIIEENRPTADGPRAARDRGTRARHGKRARRCVPDGGKR